MLFYGCYSVPSVFGVVFVGCLLWCAFGSLLLVCWFALGLVCLVSGCGDC